MTPVTPQANSPEYQCVPVARILELCNPFDTPPWANGEGVSIAGVNQAIADGRYQAEPFSLDGALQDWSVEDHNARIAFLVTHGWSEPIDIDVGVPSLNCYVEWPVTDGNHRVAAAIVRGDDSIQASVSGCCLHIEKLLGIAA